MATVLVYGATGTTGGLIARALLDRGLQVIASGRDRGRLARRAAELGGVDIRPAPVHDRAALAAAVRGVDLVVACAGPFSMMGEPVLAAAIDAGADYLDTTGEQVFMREMYERYESAARHGGVCAVSGCAFEIALGDWAAALAAGALGPGAIDEVLVAYWLDRFNATAGTRASAVESLAAGGLVWDRDRWQEAPPAAERRTFAFPGTGDRAAVSFPSGEVVTVPRHIDARRVQTFLALEGSPLGRLPGWMGAALPLLARTPLLSAARARAVGGRQPDAAARARARFAVAAQARRGFEDARVAVTGRDVYATTATIIANAAAELCARRGQEGRPVGVLAPSEAFDPDASLGALAAVGCTVWR